MREENVSAETHVVGEGMREAQTPCHVLTSFQGDNVGMIVAKTYNGPIVLHFFVSYYLHPLPGFILGLLLLLI